ncbi:MAG TPA: RMD1 family protein [Polyangiaceae bacterium]|jgi:uncharacterized Rmd1/YagE family protein
MILVQPDVVAVEAFAIAGTLSARDMDSLFEPGVERAKASKTVVVVRYSARSWAVLHDFGVLVLLGVDEREKQRALSLLAAHAASETRPPVLESFLVELQPGQRPTARFDRVVLDELDARSVELVALAVGQSVAMEYYEDHVDGLLRRLEQTSKRLADTGSFRGKGRELLSFIGEGMTTRTQVVHTLALLDAPALAWDNEALDRLFRDLRLTFAIEDRYRTLEQKLAILRDNLELLVELSQHRRATLLELFVIALIATELLSAFFRH